MKKIEVDDEVFKYLQNKAIPFVDSPNTVLRKILLLDSKENEQAIHVSSGMTTNEKEISSDDFIQKILREQFNEIFKVNPPYRMMFSSDSNLIYFQNFNKSNESLWYRITEKPFDLIKRSSKNAKICLTCPPEKKAYLIPINDILRPK